MGRDKSDCQILEIDNIGITFRFYAPNGWQFDMTSKYAWLRLCRLTDEVYSNKKRLKKDEHALHAQIGVLSNLLASSNGMSGTYWMLCARELKGQWQV